MLNKTRELIGYLNLFVYYLFSVWVLDFTRVGQRVLLLTKLDDTKFCYQLIITLTKFVIYKALFENQNTRNFKIFFASNEKKSHLSTCVMVRTVQLLRHDAYSPIKLSY